MGSQEIVHRIGHPGPRGGLQDDINIGCVRIVQCDPPDRPLCSHEEECIGHWGRGEGKGGREDGKKEGEGGGREGGRERRKEGGREGEVHVYVEQSEEEK